MITGPDPALTALPAELCGAVSAAAGEGQRDLQECAATYGGAFASKPFDPALFSTVALANSFCAPWLTADQLRIANRASLWAFGVDWAIDYLATSRTEVDEVVSRCLAVADGGVPAADDPLTRFLADIRDELTTAPAFPVLGPVWRAEFGLMLEAMAREWTWQSARAAGDEVALPTFEDYLANADNICFSFVFVSHWIVNSGSGQLSKTEELRAAGREVQVVIRLLNDLGTYHRDLSWGDLNPLMLGVSQAQVAQRIAVLTQRCEQLLQPLTQTHPDLAVFLDRYIRFNVGFYRIGDYWGKL
jgi:hypothetical protein